jgi:hypothetical protein
LFFSGIVTGGWAGDEAYGQFFGGKFNFFGDWSNGLPATGEYRFFESDYEGTFSTTTTLNTSIAPEPDHLPSLVQESSERGLQPAVD